jgi:hypothetical protein
VIVGRREAVSASLGAALVLAAFAIPHLNLGSVRPLIHSSPKQLHDYADTAPIFGWWNAHVGWGSAGAVVIGAAAVLWGPILAERLSWRVLTLVTWSTACVWAFALAMIDGWQLGFAGRLNARHEYLRQVPTEPDPGLPTAFLDHSRIRAPAGCAVDFRLARPHRSGRRRVGGGVLPAGRVERGGRRDRGSACGVR